MNKKQLIEFLGVLHFHGYIDHDVSKLGNLADMADFTTQPQPKLSAEDIDKLVEKYELNVDSFTSCFLVDKDILINICNEYRNIPIEVKHPRTEQEEADRLYRIYHDCPSGMQGMVCDEIINALQLRGLSTTFEEKVLTILKGM